MTPIISDTSFSTPISRNSSYPLLPTSKPSSEELPNTLNDIELEKVKTFIEIMFKKVQETANAPLLTCGTASTEDVFSDISFLVRIFMPEQHGSTKAAGFLTALNAFQGGFAAALAAERFALAKRTCDRPGMIESAIDWARGGAQALAGAAYAGYRGTMIAADLKDIDTSSLQAVTPLGRSAYVLGLIGNIAFTVFFTLLGIWGGYGLVKDWQFSIEMNAQKDDKLFDFLMRKVSADPKTKLEKLNKYWNLPANIEKRPEQLATFKNGLVETAISRFTNQFLKWQGELLKTDELEGNPLSKQQVKDIFKALFTERETKFKENGVYKAALSALDLTEDEAVKGFNFSTLELLGFNFEQGRRRAKKEAKIDRLAGDAKAVKKVADRGLGECLKYGDDLVKASANEKLKTLEGNITSANTKNKWIHGVMIPIAILGIVSTVLGFFPLSAAMSIVLITVTVLLIVTMLGTDGFFMWNGWKHGGVPGQYDKLYLALVSLVIVTAMAVSVGVTFGFGLALMPMYMSLGIGAASLTLSGYAYHKLDQKKKAWEENHPSLEKFEDLLIEQTQSLVMDKRVDETVSALFKKLPKADRLAIRKKYSVMSEINAVMFKQDEYVELDTSYEFGKKYIEKVISHNFADNENEYKLLTLGMKKTVKLFWERWAQTKSMENKELALKLQSLFERVSQRKLEGGDDRSKFKRELEELGPHVFEKLTNDIWYVAKRQESLRDLKNIVDLVITDKNKKPISRSDQETDLAKVTPFINSISSLRFTA